MSFIAKTIAGVGNNTDRQESHIEYNRYVYNVIKSKKTSTYLLSDACFLFNVIYRQFLKCLIFLLSFFNAKCVFALAVTKEMRFPITEELHFLYNSLYTTFVFFVLFSVTNALKEDAPVETGISSERNAFSM